MNKKPAIPAKLICLGAAAVLLLAAALLMLFAPGAPRYAGKTPDGAESGTVLTLYEGPKTMTSSATARICANGHELFVYDVMVNHEHIWNANTQPSTTPMAYFDFRGEVTLEIEMPGLGKPVETAAVRLPRWASSPPWRTAASALRSRSLASIRSC